MTATVAVRVAVIMLTALGEGDEVGAGVVEAAGVAVPVAVGNGLGEGVAAGEQPLRASLTAKSSSSTVIC